MNYPGPEVYIVIFQLLFLWKEVALANKTKPLKEKLEEIQRPNRTVSLENSPSSESVQFQPSAIRTAEVRWTNLENFKM